MWGSKRNQAKIDPMDATGLKFFEVSVAPNETWTVWNSKTMPLLFPTTTFSRFLHMTLGAEAYARFARASISSSIVSSASAKGQSAEERELAEILDELDLTIQRRQKSFDRFPTFAFFADDAVKALRAVVTARRRSQIKHQEWTEIPSAMDSKGTLISEKGRFSDLLVPIAFLPNSTIRLVEGTAWKATAYQLGSCFSTEHNSFVEAPTSKAMKIANRGPVAEFVITIVDNVIESFGVDPAADWQGLTSRFIPAQLKFAGISHVEEIPCIDPGSRVALNEQVRALIRWAYVTGILCRVLTWLDGAYRK